MSYPPPVPPTVDEDKPSRLGIWIGLAALIVVLLGGGGYLVFHRGGSHPSGPATASNGATSLDRDDFSGTSVDASRWTIYKGAPYSPDMVRVANGELQVLGIGRSANAADNLAGGLCWCGSGGNRVYGTWQVRARFDAGAGYRPILNLWPASDDAATDGAITFADDGDAARTSLRTALTPPGGAPVTASLAGDFTAWHIYRIDWRAGSVKISVDGQSVFDTSKLSSPPQVPSKAMHLAIQEQKGPADGLPAANSSTPDQVVLHVDWVSYSP